MDCDIVKLANLLNTNRSSNGSDSEDDVDDEKTRREGTEPTPGDIGKEKRKPSVYTKVNPEERPAANSVEDEESLFFNENSACETDWRKTPLWDVSYRQQVTPSDVFLQISAKNPGTASCEDMILKIRLPEEDHRNVDLKITKEHLKLLSPKFRLEIPLPHPVNPQLGNAQWNKENEQLVVTLRMDREFDFINF